MSKKTKWIIAILVVLIAVLIGLSKAGIIGGDEGLKVTAEKAAVRNITEIVTASGKIFPEIEVKVSPDISGEIVELNVLEGDTVKRGQVLARIYADIYASQRDQAAAVVTQSQAQVSNSQAQMEALKATLDQSEAAYNRQKTLLDQKVISQSEFEVAAQAYFASKANYKAAADGIKANQANVQSSMASLQRANKDVGRATITAPMDGVVSLLNVKKGERVAGNSFNIGTEMMRIADLNSIEVQVDVGENDIPKVQIGDTALIEVDAFNNRKFKGLVYKIANPVTSVTSLSSSTTVTNYQVHIRLFADTYRDLIVSGQPFPFRPDMTASADIQTKTITNVISVPLNAVTTRDKNEKSNDGKDPAKDKKDNKPKEKTEDELTAPSTVSANAADDLQEVVFVVQKDNTIKKVTVKTDVQDINYIQILQGLKAGDIVLTGPYDLVSKTIKDGDKVKIVSKEDLVQSFEKK